jgi:hypothetical protein
MGGGKITLKEEEEKKVCTLGGENGGTPLLKGSDRGD